MTNNRRLRANESSGSYTKLHGEYRLSAMTGVLVAVAAHTTTVGQIFAMRVPTAATKKAVIRYCSVQWSTKTLGTAQPMGFALAVHRGATAVYTGGTSIDCFTVTGSQKMRADQALTMFDTNAIKIATTDTLTVPATQLIDAHPISQKMCPSGALGATSELVMLDARDDGASTVRSALVLAASEVLVIKNVIAMTASVDGYATITLEWDEVTV